MTLFRKPFSCCEMNTTLLEIAWILFYPFYYSVNRHARLFRPTTKERQTLTPGKRVCTMLICFPLWLVIFLLSTVPAFFAYLIWFPLQFCRRDYRYSSSSSSSSRSRLWPLNTISLPLSLTIAQANICLLPEFATRANNLDAPTWRVRRIADKLLNLSSAEDDDDDEEVGKNGGNYKIRSEIVGSSQETDILVDRNKKRGSTASYHSNDETTVNGHTINEVRANESTAADTIVDTTVVISVTETAFVDAEADDADNPHVVEAFPENIDFLCLCEVFDRDAAKTIVDILHRRFPHIIWDISQRPALNLLKACNSGLLFASKYPITDVEFHKYDYSEGSDSLALKGVLLVKILLGVNGAGKRLAGFLTHTHLQAKLSTRSCNVQKNQLDWVEAKMLEFQTPRRLSQTEELVCCDMLTGDLNFDCSSVDEAELATHSLFQKFKDPCRDDEGNEKAWTVGTELRQRKLYDPQVSTPEGLRKILSSNDEIRGEFVASTNCPVTGDGDKNGRRRIDYICLDETVDVKISVDDDNFRFVTALATLTDHVPMAMTFTLS